MELLSYHHVVCQSTKIHSPDTDKIGHLGKMPPPIAENTAFSTSRWTFEGPSTWWLLES